jgi:hypothetical protein
MNISRQDARPPRGNEADGTPGVSRGLWFGGDDLGQPLTEGSWFPRVLAPLREDTTPSLRLKTAAG